MAEESAILAESGAGGLDQPDRRDITLAYRAVSQRWPMPKHVRDGLVDRMWQIIETARSHRSKVMAAKVIELLDRLNLADQKAAEPPPVPPAATPAPTATAAVQVNVHQPASGPTLSPEMEALAAEGFALLKERLGTQNRALIGQDSVTQVSR